MATPTSGAPAVYVAIPDDPLAGALVYGTKWLSPPLSYSFVVEGVSRFSSTYPDPAFPQAIRGFSTDQESAAQSVLGAWSSVANITFVRTQDTATTVGDVRIGFSAGFNWGTNAIAAYPPGTAPSSGDVWLNPVFHDVVNGVETSVTFAESRIVPGSSSYMGLLSAVGYALGVKFAASPSPSNPAVVPGEFDSYLYTVQATKTPADGATHAVATTMTPTTPMLLDIAAIQYLYGPNRNYNAGDTTYSFNDNPGQHYFQTIWDGGGANTIAYTGSTNSSIDLRAGHGSRIGNPIFGFDEPTKPLYVVPNVWIAYGTSIVNCTLAGSGSNVVTANDLGDRIVCGPGNDTVYGGAGADTITGGAGADVIDAGTGSDTARYVGARSNFAVSHAGSAFTVTDKTGAEGVDILTHIETLQFSDKSFPLLAPPLARAPDYGKDAGFLFDPVYYLLSNPDLVPTVGIGSALQHYATVGAAQHRAPNAWFDPVYYANKWADLKPLHLTDATLFAHYNLYGVWEGRSAGPKFDRFDGNRYLAENPDVADYVDANLAGFLGSRTNGAIAHFIIYGANEQRVAHDTTGALVDMGYIV